MLQAMLKHCFRQCSSMQKAYRVRVVRTPYGEHEQIMRGRRRRSWGTDPALESKVYCWPGLSGSARLQWRPTKRSRDAQIYFCLTIPSSVSRLTIRDRLRRVKGAVRSANVSSLMSQSLVSPLGAASDVLGVLAASSTKTMWKRFVFLDIRLSHQLSDHFTSHVSPNLICR